ncbi:MAG: 30S ribosomal protein S19e [Candidatus Woesearchaeota archaeon]|nr:MAG: 30S ribosomal protein S19e [Candidatus Woesearchaeota archaeon]
MFTVDQNKLIDTVAEELKGTLTKPDWADFVKTGVHKERPPADADWWFKRAAAVLRVIHLRGPIGVAKLRVKYGGRQDRGVKPSRFQKGSGSVLRKILQDLEKNGYIVYKEVGVHKGRVTTPKGVSLLFSTAKKIGGGKQ